MALDAQSVANAPTIASKVATETLWGFLADLPFTAESQIFYGLILGGLVGMIGHYIRGRATGDIGVGFVAYFFRENAWRSAGAFVALAGELWGEIGGGLFTTSAGAFVGFGIVIASGIKSGYIGESLLKKSSRKEWSDEQRAAATATAAPALTPQPEKATP